MVCLKRTFEMDITYKLSLLAKRKKQTGGGTYLPQDEESIGAVGRERVCVASIADPGSQNETYNTNITLEQVNIANGLG